VGGLHRLPDYPHQVVAQGIQVRLVSKLGREGFQGLGCVVLTAVEALVYEALDTSSEWIEHSGDNQGGDDYGELGLLLLAGEGMEDGLGGGHSAEVDECQHRREQSVDESAVDDEVYVEQMRA